MLDDINGQCIWLTLILLVGFLALCSSNRECDGKFFSMVSLPRGEGRCSEFIRQNKDSIRLLSSVFTANQNSIDVYIDYADKNCRFVEFPGVSFVNLRMLKEDFIDCGLSPRVAEEVAMWDLTSTDCERKTQISRICMARLLNATYMDLDVLPVDWAAMGRKMPYSIGVTIWDRPGYNFEITNSIFCLPYSILGTILTFQEDLIKEHIFLFNRRARKQKIDMMTSREHPLPGQGGGGTAASLWAAQELSHTVFQRALIISHEGLEFLPMNPPGDLQPQHLIRLAHKYQLSFLHHGHGLIWSTIQAPISSLTRSTFTESVRESVSLIRRAEESYRRRVSHAIAASATNQTHLDTTLTTTNITPEKCSHLFTVLGDGTMRDDCCNMMKTRQFQEMFAFFVMQTILTEQHTTIYIVRESPCGRCASELNMLKKLLSTTISLFKSAEIADKGEVTLAVIRQSELFEECLHTLTLADYRYKSFNVSGPSWALTKLCLALKTKSTYIGMSTVMLNVTKEDLERPFLSVLTRSTLNYGPRAAITGMAFCLPAAAIVLSIDRLLKVDNSAPRKYSNYTMKSNVVPIEKDVGPEDNQNYEIEESSIKIPRSSYSSIKNDPKGSQTSSSNRIDPNNVHSRSNSHSNINSNSNNNNNQLGYHKAKARGFKVAPHSANNRLFKSVDNSEKSQIRERIVAHSRKSSQFGSDMQNGIGPGSRGFTPKLRPSNSRRLSDSMDSNVNDFESMEGYRVEIKYDSKNKRNVYTRVKIEDEDGGYVVPSVNNPHLELHNDILSHTLFDTMLMLPRVYHEKYPDQIVADAHIINEVMVLYHANDFHQHRMNAVVNDILLHNPKFIFITQSMVNSFSPSLLKNLTLRSLDVLVTNHSTIHGKYIDFNPLALPRQFKDKSYFHLAMALFTLDIPTMLEKRANATNKLFNDLTLTSTGSQSDRDNANVISAEIQAALDALPPDLLAGLDLSAV